MKSISSIEIGKKIALVLGGTVFLLISLAALSLWAVRAGQNIARESQGRLTAARLAETIAGDSAAVAQNMGRMVIAKTTLDDAVNQIVELRKNRTAALEAFRTSAQTPETVQQASGMAGLVKAADASSDSVMTWLAADQYNEAAKEFNVSSSLSTDMYAKAKEASRLQEKLMAESEKKSRDNSRNTLLEIIGGSLLAAVAATFGGVVLTRGIAAPVAAVVLHLDRIAQGDLSVDAPADLQSRGDEIGTLARGTQTMTVSLRKMVQEVSDGIRGLSSSSANLLDSSARMTSGSSQVSEKAHSVAAAAEEMSSNISSVAAGMDGTATNLTDVAATTSQMSSTIGEIARNSENARRITQDATHQAARITENINELSIAAREIGKVTETITQISSQTNLLALNATIEAARAGAAGKGFAVVATEIKTLAQQTAAATQDIKQRITGVQAAVAGGITEIGKVSEVIDQVSEIVASIAAAIDEQSTATKNIARNIANASSSMADANTRVAETSQVSREIAKDIGDVEHAMASSSEHVRTSASELSSVAETLRIAFSRFHA